MALAWRLQRRSLLASAVLFVFLGVEIGYLAESAADLLASKGNSLTYRLGRRRFAIGATLPLRSEEVEKHVAHLLPGIIQKPDVGTRSFRYL